MSKYVYDIVKNLHPETEVQLNSIYGFTFVFHGYIRELMERADLLYLEVAKWEIVSGEYVLDIYYWEE